MSSSSCDRNAMEEIKTVPVLRIVRNEREQIEDLVLHEFPLTIELNGRELVTILCTPVDMKYLAIGFLSSAGLIRSRDEIGNVVLDERCGVIRVETKSPTFVDGDSAFRYIITSGFGKGSSFASAADGFSRIKVESDMRISVGQVYSLVDRVMHRSEVHRIAGSVHSSALCCAEEILVFADDLGRHNAIDKIFGRCLWEGIPTEGRAIVTSGRISSEMLGKAARRLIPFVISRSAATDMAIRTAEDLGVTLIGYVRGERMSIYANSWRVTDE